MRIIVKFWWSVEIGRLQPTKNDKNTEFRAGNLVAYTMSGYAMNVGRLISIKM